MENENPKLATLRACAWAEYQARASGHVLYEIIPLDIQRVIWNLGFTQGVVKMLEEDTHE